MKILKAFGVIFGIIGIVFLPLFLIYDNKNLVFGIIALVSFLIEHIIAFIVTIVRKQSENPLMSAKKAMTKIEQDK